ncbi:MAG: hypothetical protein WAU47_15770 [Desulfobaccales bacterium]
MVTASPASDQKRPEASQPLRLEIFQGREGARQFPVNIRSLSARGVILAAGQVPEDLNLAACANSDSVIHLPTGEIREVRGSLIWARPQEEEGAEVVFGLELSSSNLRVRRALEEQLLAYPQDLKNMWDHWDAVYDDHEVFSTQPPASPRRTKSPGLETKTAPNQPRETQLPESSPLHDHAFYWVGVGGVLAGLGVYSLAPETYRMFGVILAAYGCLTIAGKSVWSLVKKSPRSQG